MTAGQSDRLKATWSILAPVIFLTALSLVILFSIDLKTAGRSIEFNALNQVIYVIIGALILWAGAKSDYRLWPKLSLWLYVIMLVLLALVPAIGEGPGSVKRWIDLGFVQFQPSEFMKLALVLVLAKIMSSKNALSPWRLMLSIGYVALPAFLVLLQPDLGTAVIYGVIWLSMVSVTKINKLLLGTIILGLVAAALISFPMLAGYQQQRIVSFLSPHSDPRGSGYNVLQSVITVGSGQIFGRGLDSGSQSQLNFLPSQHTDFVFAVIAEKLGFIGASLTILALLVLTLGMLAVGHTARGSFGRMAAMGAATVIIVQSVINIGMNLGVMPVTGLPLPLVSYGGTHVITVMLMVGILLSINKGKDSLQFS